MATPTSNKTYIIYCSDNAWVMTCRDHQVVVIEKTGDSDQQWFVSQPEWLWEIDDGKFIVRCLDRGQGTPYLSAQNGSTDEQSPLVGDQSPEKDSRPVWSFRKDSKTGNYELHCAIGPDTLVSDTCAGNPRGSDSVEFCSATGEPERLWTFEEV